MLLNQLLHRFTLHHISIFVSSFLSSYQSLHEQAMKKIRTPLSALFLDVLSRLQELKAPPRKPISLCRYACILNPCIFDFVNIIIWDFWRYASLHFWKVIKLDWFAIGHCSKLCYKYVCGNNFQGCPTCRYPDILTMELSQEYTYSQTIRLRTLSLSKNSV